MTRMVKPLGWSALMAVLLIAVLALALIATVGCSSGREDAPRVDVNLGQHPAAWLRDHWSEFLRKSAQCETCHGSVMDKMAAGGISKASCFACHEDGIHHTQGFAAPSRHGRNAAQREPSDRPASMAGFGYCTKCHGSDYQGHGASPSCMGCHTKAPHPVAPWTGASAAAFSHHMTADGNAPACAQCHANGANSTRPPAAAPDLGALPGCFNNTLCHARDFR